MLAARRLAPVLARRAVSTSFSRPLPVRADLLPCLALSAAAGAGGLYFFLGRGPAPELSYETLAKNNSETSNMIIYHYKRNPKFIAYSETVTKAILERDRQDGEKLAKGVQIAVDKGVLSGDIKVEPVTVVRVDGKSVQAVSQQIIKRLGDAPQKGCIMTLQGASGTGKGTTVAELASTLPNTKTWSNGLIFRSVTLLALTYAEQNKCKLEDALTPELLKKFMGMLTFGEFHGRFDVQIAGLGMRYYCSEIENTKLRAVGPSIPTVAEVTQGEVVNFVQGALDQMAAKGFNILVEGREETLNYIRTPHRFELVLKDSNVIGMRRASQMMAASAMDYLKHMKAAATRKATRSKSGVRDFKELDDSDVAPALDHALDELSKPKP